MEVCVQRIVNSQAKEVLQAVLQAVLSGERLMRLLDGVNEMG